VDVRICWRQKETPPRWGWTGRGYAARAYYERIARAAYLASNVNAFSYAYIICLKRRVMLIEAKIMFFPAKQTAIASGKVVEIRGWPYYPRSKLEFLPDGDRLVRKAGHTLLRHAPMLHGKRCCQAAWRPALSLM
jgi:hypothetical protein